MDVPPHLNLPPRAREAVETGKLWRAKEHLSGRLAGRPFDPELHEQLGWVLLQMGDDLEAGRHLFLAQSERPEHAEAVGLFLSRHGRGDWHDLLGALPSGAQRAPVRTLPSPAREVLRTLGMPENAPRRPVAAVAARQPSTLRILLGAALLLALSLFGGASLFLGAPRVLRWLAEWVGVR